jgi:transposase
MDNVRTDKVAGVAEAIEAAGAELRYLPPYSPDLNSIENTYSKLKSDLRKGATRTVAALSRLVGRSLKASVPDECVGYFRHAGYRV